MIFFAYGTDHYRCQEKIKELIAGFVAKRDRLGLNVVRLEAGEIDFERFKQEALTVPFLGEKKLIVVKNSLRQKKFWEPVYNFLQDREKSLETMIIFVDFIIDEKKAQPNGALFNYLKKQPYVWELNLLSQNQLKAWIKKTGDQLSAKISPRAIEELSWAVGNDLHQLSREIIKLTAYKNGEEISEDDVKKLVPPKFDENIFALVDAIGQKNQKIALKLLAGQLAGGAHPLTILAMINRQFKIILQAKDNVLSGCHPFVARKAASQAANFSAKKIISINQELLNLEKQLKSGEKNPELLFDLLIAKNC